MPLSQYPAWFFHRTEGRRLVDSPDAAAALGPDWLDSPAAFADSPLPQVAVEIGEIPEVHKVPGTNDGELALEDVMRDTVPAMSPAPAPVLVRTKRKR